MKTAFQRLRSRCLHKHRLSVARRAIARAERSLARRRRVRNPGYDELRNPAFIAVMGAAFFFLLFYP